MRAELPPTAAANFTYILLRSFTKSPVTAPRDDFYFCQTTTHIMKHISSPDRFVCAFALFSIVALIARAGADTTNWTTLRQESEFKRLKPDDKVAFVCIGCKSISPISAKSPQEAAKLGKEGANVTCPNCQMITKVIVRASRKDLYAPPVVTYINEKGEEVAFMITTGDLKPGSKSSPTGETPVNDVVSKSTPAQDK